METGIGHAEGNSTFVGTTAVQDEQLTVNQTATGYWVVKRGAVELAGAVTRQAAEAERELMRRLSDRSAGARARTRRAAHQIRPSSS